MKVCIEEHISPLFGVVPVGSLWADDSPYVLDDFAHCFADPDAEPVAPAKPARKKEKS